MVAPNSLSQIETVMSQVCADDRNALATLYKLTSPQVYGALCRLLHDRDARNQAMVDTYREVWRQRRERAAVSKGHVEWVLAIAHRQALTAYYALNNSGASGEHSRSGNGFASDTIKFADMRPEMLASLDDTEAELILKSYLDGRSVLEIGKQAGLSKDEIGKQMLDIVNKMRGRS